MLKTLLLTSALILASVFGVLVTPEPIAYRTVQITWVTHSAATWINEWDVSTAPGTFQRAHSVSPGVTNTLTLEAVENVVFQIQEYKLINGRLELITFFNLEPVPHSDFPSPSPSPSQTPQPTLTPIPTNTPISNPLQVRMFTPIVMR